METKGRMSARFIGSKIGLPADSVYKTWADMGIIRLHQQGYWDLTEEGKALNGRYSKNGGVPTFKFEEIVPLMKSFWHKH